MPFLLPSKRGFQTYASRWLNPVHIPLNRELSVGWAAAPGWTLCHNCSDWRSHLNNFLKLQWKKFLDSPQAFTFHWIKLKLNLMTSYLHSLRLPWTSNTETFPKTGEMTNWWGLRVRIKYSHILPVFRPRKWTSTSYCNNFVFLLLT